MSWLPLMLALSLVVLVAAKNGGISKKAASLQKARSLTKAHHLKTNKLRSVFGRAFGKHVESKKGRRSVSDCAEGMFACANGGCLPSSWQCDNDQDCGDYSDELGCGECDSESFSCHNSGRCISAAWLCDRDEDCGDGSDEDAAVCSGRCGSNQLLCADDACIPAVWRCDGDNDCTGGEDEGLCPSETCSTGYLQCNNGRCIPESWECDGDNDCGDNLDEQFC